MGQIDIQTRWYVLQEDILAHYSLCFGVNNHTLRQTLKHGQMFSGSHEMMECNLRFPPHRNDTFLQNHI